MRTEWIPQIELDCLILSIIHPSVTLLGVYPVSIINVLNTVYSRCLGMTADETKRHTVNRRQFVDILSTTESIH